MPLSVVEWILALRTPSWRAFPQVESTEAAWAVLPEGSREAARAALIAELDAFGDQRVEPA